MVDWTLKPNYVPTLAYVSTLCIIFECLAICISSEMDSINLSTRRPSSTRYSWHLVFCDWHTHELYFFTIILQTVGWYLFHVCFYLLVEMKVNWNIFISLRWHVNLINCACAAEQLLSIVLLYCLGPLGAVVWTKDLVWFHLGAWKHREGLQPATVSFLFTTLIV